MNLKKVLSLSLGLVVLATVAVLTGTGTVGASPHLNSLITSPPPPSVPVSVVNTPLAVTGTVTANIGTPTVNANINGTPTVNVASLPPVSATLTNSSITVANPATNPVLVQIVDRVPYQQYLSLTATGGTTPDPGCSSTTSCEATIVVPAGKRFVVEHVSARAQGQGGQKYIASLRGIDWMVLTYQGTFSGIDFFTASDPMHIYIDPTSPAPAVAVTSTNGQAFFASFDISGYLVDQ